MNRSIGVGSVLGLMALAPLAWSAQSEPGPLAVGVAEDPCAPASDPSTWVATLPARAECVTREVPVPALTQTRRVPVYETIQAPVYETREVPVYQDVAVPVFETREVPVFRTRQLPVWGQREVPITHTVAEPVTLTLPNPFECEDMELELWEECGEIVCGTRLEPAIVEWREEQVADGTRTERVQVGTRSERVVCGTRRETVQVGARPEPRITGYREETAVIRPATTRQVVERRIVPCEQVTVVATDVAGPVQPLPGTSRVLTRSEYQAALSRGI